MTRKPMTSGKNEDCIGWLLFRNCYLAGDKYLVGDEQIFGYWGTPPFPPCRENPDGSTPFKCNST